MHRDQLPIAEPCHADWTAMSGDAARRFCGSCTKHVHDLSAMTAPEAERVLATEQSPCVRYAVGADGRILHATGSRWPRWVAIGAALLGATPAFASGMAAEPTEPGLMERVLRRAQEAVGLVPEVVVSLGQVEVVEVMGEPAIEPPPPPPPPERPMIMGKIARPPTIVLPPTPAPPVAPPPPDFRQIPTPAPGETVIPEVTEALRGR